MLDKKIRFHRFDFYVDNFLNSEEVKVMTAEEVGQFILLLCEAWILGKEATLPDSPSYLARIARSNAVSELVMSKFDLVETEFGIRRRNNPLYREWQAAIERSNSARERGKLGNESRRRERASTSYSDALAKASAVAELSPISVSSSVSDHNQISIKSNQKEKAFSQEVIDATIEKSKREMEKENAEFIAAKERERELIESQRGLL